MSSRVDTCVAYCVDAGFIVPALVSAAQARSQVSPIRADIAIVAVGLDARARSVIERVCSAESIRLIAVTPAQIDNRPPAYGRLYLDRLLPDHYDTIIYIDADTQVRGSLEDLLRARGRDGELQVAVDVMSFMAMGNAMSTPGVQAYMRGLGLGPEHFATYVNSGLMSIKRATWGPIAAEALAFSDRYPELCKFYDQSALNAVLRGDVSLLSLKWNFPAFLRNCGVEREIEPVMYHFCGKPRPWNGVFPPWDESFTSPYGDLMRRYPELLAYAPPAFSLARHAKYFLQQRLRVAWEGTVWQFGSLRGLMLDYERSLKRTVETPRVAPSAIGA